MNIYLQTETDFTHNGLGFLTDVLNANVIDNLNGEYSLNFEYKINGHLNEYLQNENIVKTKVSDGTQQLFIIKNVIKTFEKIQVNCVHIFYSLLDNFLEDTAPTNLSPQPFLIWILEKTNYKNRFVAYSDISTPKSARYVRRNPVDCILGDTDNSMVNLFGGELRRDNFNIYFNKKIGNDNGVKLNVGKNITGINITTDTNSLHTRIMPQGYDGLFLPEKYVDSPLIELYPNPKIYKVEFNDIKYNPEDEEAYQNLNDAFEALREGVKELYENGMDKPNINVKVDWIELSKTNEYKQYSNLEKVGLGDTISINLLGITYKTRVIKTTYNPLVDRVESFELGTPKANISSTTNNIQREITKINPTSILETAKDNATQMLIQAMGGFVYKTQNELFIMDTDNPNTATKIWRWNMNGLGYSSNGIDGPYETAITSDGKIVADFITTGKLDTSVIEGYDSLLLKISEIADLTREVSGNKYIELNDAISGDLISLRITGEISILPSKYIFPSENLFPHDAFYLKVTNEVEDEETGEISFKSTRYKLPFYSLHEYGDVKDEFIIDDGKAKLIKRIGIDANDDKYLLTQPVEQTFDDIVINLQDGYNRFELVDFPSATLSVKYAIQSEYSKVFATKAELDSSITLTKDEINLEVSKKVDNDEIISTINQSAEEVKIKANKIGLEGYTTINEGFSVDEEGNMSCADANINRGNIKLVDNGSSGRARFIIQDQNNKSSYLFSDMYAQYTNNFDVRIGTNTSNNDAGWLDIVHKSSNANFGVNVYDSSSNVTISSGSSSSGSIQLMSDGLGDGNPTVLIMKNSADTSITQNGVWSPSFNNTSIEEVKKNIRKLTTNALKLITSTDLYKYNYKDESNKDKKHIGIVIGDGYNYPEEILSSDGKGVDLYSMVSVCFKAIQEQQVQIQELKDEINKLKEGDK